MKTTIKTISRRKMIPMFSAVAVVLGFCGCASAATLYDNLDAPFSNANGGDPFWLGPEGDSFSTGSAPVMLGNVQLLLSGNGTPGTLTIDLLSDNSTAPGSVLNTIGTISTDVLTSTPTVFTLTAPFGIILSPNTRYWLQATGSGSVMSDYSHSAAAWDIEYPAGLADVGVAGEYLEFPQASDMNYYAHGVPNPSLPDSVWPSYYGST